MYLHPILVKSSEFSKVEDDRYYSCRVNLCWSCSFFMASISNGGFGVCTERGGGPFIKDV